MANNHNNINENDTDMVFATPPYCRHRDGSSSTHLILNLSTQDWLHTMKKLSPPSPPTPRGFQLPKSSSFSSSNKEADDGDDDVSLPSSQSESPQDDFLQMTKLFVPLMEDLQENDMVTTTNKNHNHRMPPSFGGIGGRHFLLALERNDSRLPVVNAKLPQRRPRRKQEEQLTHHHYETINGDLLSSTTTGGANENCLKRLKLI